MEKIRNIIVDSPFIYIEDPDINEIWKQIKTDELLKIIFESLSLPDHQLDKFKKDVYFFLEDSLDCVGESYHYGFYMIILDFRKKLLASIVDLALNMKIFQFATILGDNTLLLHKPNKDDI